MFSGYCISFAVVVVIFVGMFFSPALIRILRNFRPCSNNTLYNLKNLINHFQQKLLGFVFVLLVFSSNMGPDTFFNLILQENKC